MPAISDYLLSYRVGQQMGQVEETASVELEHPSPAFTIDSDVTLNVAGASRDYFISKYSKRFDVGGWNQTLELVSPISKFTKKAPKKTQMFMTMSQDDYNKFLRELAGGIEYLDYVPHIQLGDTFGVGGWTLLSIINTLSSMMGVTVHCNLPDYPIKQVSVSPSQTYFDAIVNLVAPLDPYVYSVAGQIFITESGAMERDFGTLNQFALTNKKLVSEEIIRKDKPSQIRLVGAQGEFRAGKYKGYTNDFQQLVATRIGSFSIWNYTYGTATETITTQSGRVAFELVPLFLSFGAGGKAIDPDSGIINDFEQSRLTVTHGKDVFGNKAYELSQVRDTYKYRSVGGLLLPVLYRRSSKGTVWEGTHWRYEAPRQIGNIVGKTYTAVPAVIEVVDQMVWYPSGSQVVFGMYYGLEESYTYYWYNDNDELVMEGKDTFGIVYTEDNETYKVLGEGVKKEDISATGKLLRVGTQSEVTHYIQLSKDSYGTETITVWLGTDGTYKTRTYAGITQAGAMQGSPLKLRTMQPYAETGAPGVGTGADMSSVMTTPAHEISIDTPSWEALDKLLPLFQNRLTKDEIIREYEVLGELNVHLGLQVDMPAETHMSGVQMSAPGLDPNYKPVIVGYQISKDVTNNRATTHLTVKGRLA